MTLLFVVQYWFASFIASAFRVPDPEKPVAAWRETMKVSGPTGAIPEFAAHPATRTAAAADKMPRM